jgi:hypothetical protein
MKKTLLTLAALVAVVGCSKDIPTTVCTTTTENVETKAQGEKK